MVFSQVLCESHRSRAVLGDWCGGREVAFKGWGLSFHSECRASLPWEFGEAIKASDGKGGGLSAGLRVAGLRADWPLLLSRVGCTPPCLRILTKMN